MKHLSIDIETRSSVDIGKAGLYKYAQSPDFRILLFAFQEDENPVEVVDLAQGEEIPEHAVRMLADPDVTKHAYNAAFEWYCLNRAGYQTPLEQWRCTADTRPDWTRPEKPSAFPRTSRSWLPERR